jgi:hypothetical protein
MIKLIRGDHRILQVHAEVNIQSSLLEFTIRKHAGSTEALIYKTSADDGIAILDDGSPELLGRASVYITPDDWEGYPVGGRKKMPWDLQETHPTLGVTTLAGTPLGDEYIEVLSDLTRASAYVE